MTMIALAVVLLLAAVAVAPKRPSQQQTKAPEHMLAIQQPVYSEPAVASLRSVSIREQQVTEEADAIAQIYRERSHEAWVAELTKTASVLLAGKTAKS